MTGISHAYVIGLEEGYRGDALEVQLASAGLGVERVRGVVGTYKGVDVNGYVDQTGAEVVYGHRLTSGEIGCALAHRSVYERALAQGDPWSLVLEDDARLQNPANLQRVIEEVSRSNAEAAAIIVLYARGALVEEKIREWEGGFAISSLLITPFTTTAYVVNRPALELLLNSGLPLINPADWPMRSEGWIRYFSAYPFPFEPADDRFPSSVGSRAQPRRGLAARLTHRISVVMHINWLLTRKYWKNHRAYWNREIVRVAVMRAMGSSLTYKIPVDALDPPVAPEWLSKALRFDRGGRAKL